MPVGAAIGIGSAISGVSAIYGAKKGADSAKRSGQLDYNATSEALAWEREQEQRRRDEYEAERARQWALDDQDRQRTEEDRQWTRGRSDEQRQWDREQFAKREGRLAPYRDFGEAGMSTLASLLRPNANAPSLRVSPRPDAPGAPMSGPLPPQMAAMPSLTPPRPPTLAQLAGRRPAPR